MLKAKYKLLSFILIFSLILSIINIHTFAIYEDKTDEEVVQILIADGNPEYTYDKSKRLNGATYKKYEVVAYGYPFGDKDDFSEYRYLGYDYNNKAITNDLFQNDATSNTDLKDKNWIISSGNESTWEGKLQDELQSEQILYSNVENDGTQLNESLADILSKKATAESELRQYIEVMTPPTILGKGTLKLRHRTNDGNIYYDTFTVEKLPYNVSIDTILSTDKESYAIPFGEDSINVSLTVEADINLDGLDSSKINNITIEYDNNTQNVNYSNPSYTYNLTFNRTQLNEGENIITFEGVTELTTIYGDKIDDTSKKSIVIDVVTEENANKPNAIIDLSSYSVKTGDEVIYNDLSTAPEGSSIVDRELTIKDENNNIVDTYKDTLTKNLSYDNYGTYEFILTVTADNGLSDTDIKYLTVSQDIPPKPDVDRPDADIHIVPRDNDPNTPSDEIYEGEHIKLEGYIEGGFSPRWRVDAGASNYSGSGIINGLFLCDYPESEADAYQAVKYEDYEYDSESKSYKKVTKTEKDFVYFTVKQIKPPVVEISGDFTDDNLNILHLEEPYNVVSVSYDINEPSEQHPDGFNVINEGWQFLDKDTGEIVLEGDGLLNDDNFILDRDIFQTEKYYIFRTIASNAFKPIRRTEHDVEIYIENLPPQVELEIVSEDGQAPTFAKEEFNVNVNARDKDGVVADAKIEILNTYPELSYLGKIDVLSLFNEYYEGNFRYISDIPNSASFRVTVTDEKGAETILDINENIIRPSVYADISVVDEDNIQKKIYRYIEYDFTNSYENAPFGIDHTSNLIKYRKNNGEWNQIPTNQNFEDENIRVYFPNYPLKDIMGVYYKSIGDYDLSLKVFDNKGFDSEEEIKSLTIAEDEQPIINYNIESTNHRITENDIIENNSNSLAITEANIGKGYIKIVDNSKSNDGDKLREKVFYIKYDKNNDGIDNDIEYTTTITEDAINGYDSTEEIVVNAETNNNIKVKDINNVILTFLTKTDGMGDYFIKAKVKEKITQLPPTTSPLYNELLAHELVETSNYSSVFIDNLKPSITFEIGKDKEINIIIHYDDYMTQEMQDKINELVNNLENRGLKVKVIKHDNKY